MKNHFADRTKCTLLYLTVCEAFRPALYVLFLSAVRRQTFGITLFMASSIHLSSLNRLNTSGPFIKQALTCKSFSRLSCSKAGEMTPHQYTSIYTFQHFCPKAINLFYHGISLF